MSLPTALGIAAWYGIIDTIDTGSLGRVPDISLLAGIVIIVAFAVSVILARFVRWYQDTVYPKPEHPLTARQRAQRTITGGIIVPAAVVAAMAFAPVIRDTTALQIILAPETTSEPSASLTSEIVRSVTSSTSMSTRVDGIAALGSIASTASGNGLLTILRNDITLLRHRRYYDALRTALAQSETTVQEPLIALYGEYDARMQELPGEPPPDLYTAHFRDAFAVAREDVIARSAGTDMETHILAALDSTEAVVQQNIRAAETAYPPTDSTCLLPEFILETLLETETADYHPTVPAFAVQIAQTDHQPLRIRALAVRLAVRSGIENHDAFLIPYLQSSHEQLRQAALQAVRYRNVKQRESAGETEED